MRSKLASPRKILDPSRPPPDSLYKVVHRIHAFMEKGKN